MCVLWILPLGIAVTKSFTVNGFGNYAYVLQYDKIHYSRVISNSMFISVTVSVVVTLITSLAGYAFSKMHFRGSKVIYGAILAASSPRRGRDESAVCHDQAVPPAGYPLGVISAAGRVQRADDAADDQKLL